MNIAKKITKKFNIKDIPERKFGDRKKDPPAPLIELDIYWEFFDKGESKQKDQFSLTMGGTYYKKILSDYYEITKWEPKNNAIIDTGDKKLDKIISDTIVKSFYQIAFETKKLSKRDSHDGILLRYDFQYDEAWDVDSQDFFHSSSFAYADNNYKKCIEVEVYGNFIENEPKPKNKTKNHDSPSCE